ncbi:MAG: nucleotidyltransferase domain-containing protein [Candidatus Shapirobacteria bacterium]
MSHDQYSNQQVATYLQNIATVYTILQKGHFRIVAYENATDTILNYPENLYTLWLKDPKQLDAVPNIGPSILKKIDYFFKYGKLYPSLKPLFKKIHPAVFAFTPINGVGPLIAQKLAQHLRFSHTPSLALDQLIKYAQTGKIRKIPGLSEKSEKLILDNTLSFLGRQNRMPYKTALKLANQIIAYLHQKFPKIEFMPLGSLRRQSDTVGDIDLATATDNPKPIIDYFLAYPKSVETITSGKNKASLRLLHDVHVDLMIKPPSSFGSLLQHFTGNKLHNILLRKHALKLGFSLSEYGIKNLKTGKIKRFSTEVNFYNFLGLKFIPPQYRLGKSEIEDYKLL